VNKARRTTWATTPADRRLSPGVAPENGPAQRFADTWNLEWPGCLLPVGRKQAARIKDYRQGGRQRQMTLAAGEFARRWLRQGLVRIRHYGLLANRGRTAKLAACRRLLGVAVVVAAVPPAAAVATRSCAVCGEGWMVVVQLVPRWGLPCAVSACREDSS
jgi:hypothetical protein